VEEEVVQGKEIRLMALNACLEGLRGTIRERMGETPQTIRGVG